jgi:hypothetical protein
MQTYAEKPLNLDAESVMRLPLYLDPEDAALLVSSWSLEDRRGTFAAHVLGLALATARLRLALDNE